ncbi:MAG TPA: DEAD/DEAH box helicase [Verrucomicrobiae bacterium]|nr:DEAD/DEAH box helicase [Verrucomicrobiae bacterium]
MRRVKLEGGSGDFILRPVGNGNPFSTADTIYFRNLLSAEHDVDSNTFTFRKQALGKQGPRYLFTYLDAEGFQLELDAAASRTLDTIKKGRKVLEQSRQAGAVMKQVTGGGLNTKGLKRRLKPFQLPATSHMIKVAHSANFSVPGSGKTTIALAAFAHLQKAEVVNVLVVVGPRSSFAPWETEAIACLATKPRIVRITGNKSHRHRAWHEAIRATVVILNYQVAANDVEQLESLLSARAAMLVVDESHYIKNIGDGKWTNTMRSVAPLAAKRVILSGTPAPNGLADLWAQFTFLYPDEALLGTKDQFVHRIQNDADPVKSIKRDLGPLFWRIKKRDLGLPRPKVAKLKVKFGPIQAAIYDALAFKTLRDIKSVPADAARLKMWRRAKMIRLLQAASNPSLLAQYSDQFRLPPLSSSGLSIGKLIDHYPEYEVPAKIRAAVHLINQLTAKGRKVILWTTFIHNIRMLMQLLKDLSPLPLFGGIPLSEQEDAEINRENIINKFKTDSSAMLLVANPAACAESISLHKVCGEAIYLDRTFNCAHFLQSKDRIHRVGLTHGDRVNYYYLISYGSIDEVVDSRLVQKERRMLELLEQDFGAVDFDSNEDIVSEDSDENVDFAQTMNQIRKRAGHAR